tara:strand:+ start:1820 stop:2956 length:1137 start_codon:yes stop_codon:yes gene_type:complete
MTKVNGRRLNGEGTITDLKHRGRGGFMGRVQVDGKRVTVYGKSRGEVRDKMRESVKRSHLGAITNIKKETVAEYFERWYTSGNIRQKSRDSRVININRMNPYIGALKLIDLKPNHISDMYDRLKETLSDYSVRQAHAILRKALRDAVKSGEIIANPIDRLLEVPTVKAAEINPLAIDEVKSLLSVNDKWTPLWTLLVYTGLRRGEALGLTWDNVDLESDTPLIKVTRSLVSTRSNGLKVNDPKTEKSNRVVPIGKSVVQVLRQHRIKQNELRLRFGHEWKNNNLVFPNNTGEFMQPSVVNRNLNRTVSKVSIDRHVRVQDLRHTCATLMVQQSVQVNQVQRTLGHSNYSTTMDVYVHTNPENLRDAINTLDSAINLIT